MAVRKPILKVGGDVSEARRALAELKDDAKDIDRIRAEARVTVETAAAEAKLKQLNDRLTNLARQEYTPQVALREGQITAQIARVEEKLRRLNGKDVTVDVKVRNADSVERVLKRVGGAVPTGAGGGFFSGILGGIGSAIGQIGALSSAIGGVVQSLTSMVPVIGESVAGFAGLAAAGAVAIPLVFALGAAIAVVVGALGALAASLAAAVAGAAILATAFGAALLGPFVIVAAVIAKLVKLFGALGKSKEQAAGQAQQSQAVAQAEAQAQQQLADAYANLKVQTEAARQAQVDATEAVKDDLLARQQSALGIEGATLATRRALQDLADFRKKAGAGDAFDSTFKKLTDVSVRFDPGKLKGQLANAGANVSDDDALRLAELIHNVREARLAEKQAADALHDSNVKLGRDRKTEADFAQKGLAAYGPYLSALRQVRDAQASVAQATSKATAAAASQGAALDKLSPHDRALAARLRGVAREFKAAFGPAVSAAVDGAVTALGILARTLNDPKIRKALKGIGDELHDAFIRIARFLSDPASRKALADFLNTGRKLIRPLTGLFIALAKLVRDLATDALPSLVRGLEKFARKVTVFEEKNGGAKKLAGTVKGLVSSFKDWVKIGQGVSSIIIAFLRGGKRDGDKMAKSIGDMLVDFGKFLNTDKGQAKIRGFFSTVRRILTEIVALVDHLYKVIVAIPRAISNVPKALLGPLALPGVANIVHKALDFLNPVKHIPGHAAGGLVTGPSHPVDSVVRRMTGGEFVIRKAVVDSLGLGFFNQLNSGRLPALAAAPAGGHGRPNVTHVHMTAPAGANPDAHYVAAKIGQLLEQRGRG